MHTNTQQNNHKYRVSLPRFNNANKKWNNNSFCVAVELVLRTKLHAIRSGPDANTKWDVHPDRLVSIGYPSERASPLSSVPRRAIWSSSGARAQLIDWTQMLRHASLKHIHHTTQVIAILYACLCVFVILTRYNATRFDTATFIIFHMGIFFLLFFHWQPAAYSEMKEKRTVDWLVSINKSLIVGNNVLKMQSIDRVTSIGPLSWAFAHWTINSKCLASCNVEGVKHAARIEVKWEVKNYRKSNWVERQCFLAVCVTYVVLFTRFQTNAVTSSICHDSQYGDSLKHSPTAMHKLHWYQYQAIKLEHKRFSVFRFSFRSASSYELCTLHCTHTHTRDKIWNLCKLIGTLLSSCTMQTLSFNSHMLLFVWVFIPALAAFRSPTLPITGKFITNSFLRNVICYWSIWCDLLVHTAATYHIVDLFKRH